MQEMDIPSMPFFFRPRRDRVRLDREGVACPFLRLRLRRIIEEAPIRLTSSTGAATAVLLLALNLPA